MKNFNAERTFSPINGKWTVDRRIVLPHSVKNNIFSRRQYDFKYTFSGCSLSSEIRSCDK